MSCSLNLASCRLRAESLARQLHSSLWLPRSPGDSGSVSPCFGLPPSALLVVDRQPANGHLPLAAMDSVDSDLCSPPYSPLESEGLMPKTSPGGLFDKCKEENHVWRPDSPPESFASESEAPSDSPALTIETDETNSVETVSELASPTDEYLGGEESPLADELRTRLRLIQSSLSDTTLLASPTDEEDTASTLSSSVHLLSPPELPRLVRSTSLKTGKTPPDTPSRKKIVRFADVLGLDLEAIRHFAKDDDAPLVPPSAFADLQVAPPAASSGLSPLLPPLNQPGFRLEPEFTSPGIDPFFLDRVRQQKVCLEDVVLSGSRVSGVVRVLNLGFEKQVCLRYTTNEWASHADLSAEYVPSSCDGFSDKFSFSLDFPHLTAGQRMHFCVRYIANGQEFWDNNCGQNYVLRCRPASPEREDEETATTRSWLHHFM